MATYWTVTIEKTATGRRHTRSRVLGADAAEAGRKVCVLVGGPAAGRYHVVMCTPMLAVDATTAPKTPPLQALRALAGESEPDAAEVLVRAADAGDAMLQALRALMAKHDDRDGLSDLWPVEAHAARAAIARAEGR